MAGGERCRTERELVLEGGGPPLGSVGELSERCLPTLTARLWATCCWPATMRDGWKIGDRNFLIAEVCPDPETAIYVQFWSEPLEPVIAEVCSGEWNPGAVKYVRSRQRQELEALGYTIGAKSPNFRKELAIRTSADAEAAASEALGVFYSVFGYRGQWTLGLKWHQGERAEHEPVYSAVTPRDFAKLAEHFGFGVSPLASARPSLCLTTWGRGEFVARFDERVGQGALHSLVTLEAPLALAGAVDGATVEALCDALRFARVSRSGQSELTLTMSLRLGGGVTVGWLAAGLGCWLQEWRACRWLLRSRERRGRTGPTRRGPGGSTVH